MVENETRGFDVNARLTVPMRDKEVKQDYRFMPGMLTNAIFCNLLHVLHIYQIFDCPKRETILRHTELGPIG